MTSKSTDLLQPLDLPRGAHQRLYIQNCPRSYHTAQMVFHENLNTQMLA